METHPNSLKFYFIKLQVRQSNEWLRTESIFKRKPNNLREFCCHVTGGKIWLYSLIAKIKSGIVPVISVIDRNSSFE